MGGWSCIWDFTLQLIFTHHLKRIHHSSRQINSLKHRFSKQVAGGAFIDLIAILIKSLISFELCHSKVDYFLIL